MSSLVAYGSSDESENESANEEDNTTIETVDPKNTTIDEPLTVNDSIHSQNEYKNDTKQGLFSALPSPKTKTRGLILDFDSDKLIETHKHLQKKQPVKIIIPSLTEFKDEEDQEPEKKKLKPSAKGSGLFSILPAPKNLSVKETKRPLVPNVLTKKLQVSPPIGKKATNTTQKATKSVPVNNSAPLINYGDSEEESDGEGDFFSLKENYNGSVNINKETESDTTSNISNISEDNSSIDAPTLVNESIEPNNEPLSFNSKFNPSPWASGSSQSGHAVEDQWESNTEASSLDPETSNSGDYISVRQDDLELDDEALQRLCGRRAKRQQQDMQLIDVSGDAIMPDPKEWLTKQLTQEQAKMQSHSHRKNDGPTTQQRRKHQITYLAFQAKENELELKNQWSQNRMSRKQTQSKYGF